MSFESDVDRHQRALLRKLYAVWFDSVHELHRSITEGSQITGAPGQPVQSGDLLGSWIPHFLETWLWQDTTKKVYAPAVEEGVGPHGRLTLRSAVGGFHSVKLSRMGWPRIVDFMAKKHGATEVNLGTPATLGRSS